MTREELAKAVDSGKEVTMDDLIDLCKLYGVTISVKQPEMRTLIGDVRTFLDYMETDIYDEQKFKRILKEYIEDGIDAEYFISDLIKVTLND